MESNIKLNSGILTSNANLPNAAKIARDKEQQTAKINKQKELWSGREIFNKKRNKERGFSLHRMSGELNNNMYIQKSMNKFQGMSAPAQLSDAPKGKQWEQHQRIKEGEEAFNQTARRGEIESDERMQRAIESRKNIPAIYLGGGGGGGGGGGDFETPKVRKKIGGNATQPPKVSSQQKSLAQVGKELGWPGY